MLSELNPSSFDEATQVMLATTYLEACRQVDTVTTPSARLERFRDEIRARILQLAAAGERDALVIKREALRSILEPDLD